MQAVALGMRPERSRRVSSVAFATYTPVPALLVKAIGAPESRGDGRVRSLVQEVTAPDRPARGAVNPEWP
jgi:hypothetical protein